MGARPRGRSTRIVDLIDLADRTIEACLARMTDASGITRDQWRTLMMLDEGTRTDGVDPPGHTMGEVAVRVAVPAPTATRMVDKLVADGLAFRRSDPWDRRRVLVHISPAGHTLVAAVAKDLDELFGTAVSDLDAADRTHILGLLERMGAALSAGERVPSS